MGKKTYCPYLDKSMMERQAERKTTVKEKGEKRESFMTPKELSNLDYGTSDSLNEGVELVKVSKKDLEKALREQKGAGMCFTDPLGFKKRV